MENIAAWLALAEKYGVTILLLGITISMLYYIAKWIGAKFDRLFAIVTEVKQIVPDPAQESVEMVTRLNKGIKGLLREVQLDFKPEWVHFWQFHNGSRVVGKSRIPFMYISLTHELALEGSEPVQLEFVQLPLSMVDGIIFTLIDNPLLIERADPTGFSDNPITKRMYEVGATVQDLLPVKDSDACIIGLLELCWKIPPDLSPVRKNNLSDYSHRLGIILSTYDETET